MLPITTNFGHSRCHATTATSALASSSSSLHEVQLHALEEVAGLLLLDPSSYKQNLTTRLNQVLDTPFVTSGHIDIRRFVEHLQHSLSEALGLSEADPLRCFLRGSIARALLLDRDPTAEELADIDLMIDLSEHPVHTLLANDSPLNIINRLITDAIGAASDCVETEISFYSDSAHVPMGADDTHGAAWTFARIMGPCSSLEIFIRLQAHPICVFAFDDLSLVIPTRQSTKAPIPLALYCSTSFYPLQTAIDDARTKKITLNEAQWLPQADALVRAFRHACQGYQISPQDQALIVRECLDARPALLQAGLRRLKHHHFSAAEQALLPLQISTVSSEWLPDAYIPNRLCYFEKFHAEHDYKLLLHLIATDLKAAAHDAHTRDYDIALLSNWIAPWLLDVPLPDEFSGKLLSWPRFDLADFKRSFTHINVSANLGQSIFCLRSAQNLTGSDAPIAHCKLIEDALNTKLQISPGMAWLYLSQLPLNLNTLLQWDRLLSIIDTREHNPQESCYILGMSPQVQAWLVEGSFSSVAELRALLLPPPLLTIYDHQSLLGFSADQIAALNLYLSSDQMDRIVEHEADLDLETIWKLYLAHPRSFAGPIWDGDIKRLWLMLALIPLQSWSRADFSRCLSVIARAPASDTEVLAHDKLLKALHECVGTAPHQHCNSLEELVSLFPHLDLPFSAAINTHGIGLNADSLKLFSTMSRLLERKEADSAWILPVIWLSYHCTATEHTPLIWQIAYEDDLLRLWHQQEDPIKALSAMINMLEKPLQELLNILSAQKISNHAIDVDLLSVIVSPLWELGQSFERNAPLRASMVAQIIVLLHQHGDKCLQAPALFWALSTLIYQQPQKLTPECTHQCAPWIHGVIQACGKNCNGKARLEQMWLYLLRSCSSDGEQLQQCLLWAGSWGLLKHNRMAAFMRKHWLKLAENGDALVRRIAMLPDGLIDATEADIAFQIYTQDDFTHQELDNILIRYLEAHPDAWHKKLEIALGQKASLALQCLVLQTSWLLLLRAELTGTTKAKLLELANTIGHSGRLDQISLTGPCLLLMNAKQYAPTIHEQFHEQLAHATCSLSGEILDAIPPTQRAQSLSTLLARLHQLHYQPNEAPYRQIAQLISYTIGGDSELLALTYQCLNRQGVPVSAIIDSAEVAAQFFQYQLVKGTLHADNVIDMIQKDPQKSSTLVNGLLNITIDKMTLFLDWAQHALDQPLDGAMLTQLDEQRSPSCKLCQVLVKVMYWAKDNIGNRHSAANIGNIEAQLQSLLGLLMRAPYAGYALFAAHIADTLGCELPERPSNSRAFPIYEEHTLVSLCQATVETQKNPSAIVELTNYMAMCVIDSLIILNDLKIHEPWWKLMLKHEQLCDAIDAERLIDLIYLALATNSNAKHAKKTAFHGPRTADVLRRAILRIDPNMPAASYDNAERAISAATTLLANYQNLLTIPDVTLHLTKIIARFITNKGFYDKYKNTTRILFDYVTDNHAADLDAHTRSTIATFYFFRGVQGINLCASTASNGQPLPEDEQRSRMLLKAITLAQSEPKQDLLELAQMMPWLRPANDDDAVTQAGKSTATLSSFIQPRLELLKKLEVGSYAYIPWMLDIFAVLSSPRLWRKAQPLLQDYLADMLEWAHFIYAHHTTLLANPNQELWGMNRWVYFGVCLFLQRCGVTIEHDLIQEFMTPAPGETALGSMISDLTALNLSPDLDPQLACGSEEQLDNDPPSFEWLMSQADLMLKGIATLSMLYLEADDMASFERLHQEVYEEAGVAPYWSNYARLACVGQMCAWLEDEWRPEIFPVVEQLLHTALGFLYEQRIMHQTRDVVGSSEIIQEEVLQLCEKSIPIIQKHLGAIYGKIDTCSEYNKYRETYARHFLAPVLSLALLGEDTLKSWSNLARTVVSSWHVHDCANRERLLKTIALAFSAKTISKYEEGFASITASIHALADRVTLKELYSMFENSQTALDKALVFDWIRFRGTVFDEWCAEDANPQLAIDMLHSLIADCDRMEAGNMKDAVMGSILLAGISPWCSHGDLAHRLAASIPGTQVSKISAHMITRPTRGSKKTLRKTESSCFKISANGLNPVFALLDLWCTYLPHPDDRTCNSQHKFISQARVALNEAALAGSSVASWCLRIIQETDAVTT